MAKDPKSKMCETCGGAGVVPAARYTEPMASCPTCRGEGVVADSKTEAADGDGN